jgi:hypothetical protein
MNTFDQNISSIVECSLYKYFNYIGSTGYLNYRDVYNIVYLTFIDDIINGCCGELLLEVYNQLIKDLLDCLCTNTPIVDSTDSRYLLETSS